MEHQENPSPDQATTGRDLDSGEPTWVAFDVEYTGANSAPHLLEIAAVAVRAGEVQDHFQSLVAPPVPIDPESTLIHGIVDEDVRSAPFVSEVLPAFFDWIGTAGLVAHGASADARVLGFECARLGITPPENPLFDSLKLAKRAWGAAPDHRLDTLVEFLELEADTAHRALSDATTCWQVVELALAELEPEVGPDAGGLAAVATQRSLIQFAGTPTRLALAIPPRPHRRPAQLRALERARAAGDTITMLYGEPPNTASIEVRPCLLYRAHKRGYVEAECIRSGSLKTYRLDRIQKLAVNDSRSA